MRGNTPKNHGQKVDYHQLDKQLNDLSKTTDELSCKLSTQTIDEFESNLRSIWQHNPDYIKFRIEPAIKELRANLP